jgi:hypothetical protein
MAKRPTPSPGVPAAVPVRPGAGRTPVGGRHDGPHRPALIVAAGAPAVDRRVAAAVRRALGVRAAAVSLRLGAAGRDKVSVDADDALISDRLGPRDGVP